MNRSHVLGRGRGRIGWCPGGGCGICPLLRTLSSIRTSPFAIVLFCSNKESIFFNKSASLSLEPPCIKLFADNSKTLSNFIILLSLIFIILGILETTFLGS